MNQVVWTWALLARRWLALALLAGLTVWPTRGAEVKASVDRPSVTLGEIVTLTLSVNGGNLNQPELPPIPNFQIVGRGSSFSFDGASGVSQQSFNYQLSPTQVGDFTIPAFQFRIGKQVSTTQPIQIKVLKPGTAVNAPGETMPTAFVRLLTPKPQLYVGEVSQLEVQVFFLEGRITQYPNLPTDPGLTGGKWLEPGRNRASVSNQVYNVISFKQPITAVKAGLLNVGPAAVSLRLPDRSRPRDFFFGTPEREVSLMADAISLQAIPVPEKDVPATFAGAVGEYTLSVTAGPTNLAVGDPITVRAVIQGRGSLDGLQLPAQPAWRDFKAYPATSRIEGADANNTSGSKFFEQVIIPERAGLTELPPLTFTYFDPQSRAYRTLTGPRFPLTVSASAGQGSALPNLPGGTNAAPAQPGSELAHIKPHLGRVDSTALLLRQPGFLALQLVPPGLWLGLLLWSRRRERLNNDPAWRRRGEVAQKIRRGLGELREQAQAQKSEEFFAGTLRLLQEQIGERIQSPANAITESVVEERLRPGGAPEPVCAAVHELFQACNLARYAGAKSSQELAALLPKLESTLNALRDWQPRK